jgi:hypothetical protein
LYLKNTNEIFYFAESQIELPLFKISASTRKAFILPYNTSYEYLSPFSLIISKSLFLSSINKFGFLKLINVFPDLS